MDSRSSERNLYTVRHNSTQAAPEIIEYLQLFRGMLGIDG